MTQSFPEQEPRPRDREDHNQTPVSSRRRAVVQGSPRRRGERPVKETQRWRNMGTLKGSGDARGPVARRFAAYLMNPCFLFWKNAAKQMTPAPPTTVAMTPMPIDVLLNTSPSKVGCGGARRRARARAGGRAGPSSAAAERPPGGGPRAAGRRRRFGDAAARVRVVVVVAAAHAAHGRARGRDGALHHPLRRVLAERVHGGRHDLPEFCIHEAPVRRGARAAKRAGLS